MIDILAIDGKLVPTPEMCAVLGVADDYLQRASAEVVSRFPLDPPKWCRDASVSPATWDAWVAEYGEAFTAWFGQGLQPSRLELDAMDALYWRAWRNALTEDKPSAAHLKTWGELRGHFDAKPPPPPVRHLSESEAIAELVALGPDVLSYALDRARALDAARRGQTPQNEPSSGTP
jgi:hypothetical protein